MGYKSVKQLYYEIKGKIGIFRYNFGWDKYVKFIDGWIPKVSLAVPLIAYLILFNDSINELIQFKKITNDIVIGLNSSQRLKCIYFGLVFLGISNVIYHFKKPYLFKFGDNYVEYLRTSLEVFTFHNYIEIHNYIQNDGHFTQAGNYSKKIWSSFEEEYQVIDDASGRGDWGRIKSKYGDLLIDLLEENWFKYTKHNIASLALCLFLSTIGYLLLIAPSIDLFMKVLLSTIFFD